MTRIYAYLMIFMCNPVWAAGNVAPLSSITSTPYMGATLSYLVDGRVGSLNDGTLMMAAPLPIVLGMVVPVTYEFVFPRPFPITQVRLYQPPAGRRSTARGYVIDIDTNGDREYDRRITEERHGASGRWFSYRISPPSHAYSLRFRTTNYQRTPGPNYGGAVISEFEIYTDASVPELEVGNRTAKSSQTSPDSPNLAFQAEQSVSAQPARLTEDADTRNWIPVGSARPQGLWSKQFQRGLFGSMWLYWSVGQEYDASRNRGRLNLLKRLNANRYWLYPEVYVPNNKNLTSITIPKNADYRYFIDRQLMESRRNGIKIVPFPSSVVPGYHKNMLKQFVEQMHDSNIGVIVNELLLPYGLSGWDFPRVMKLKEYPSVLNSSFVRIASTTLYRELMEAGADGLALGGDEFFLYGDLNSDETTASICWNEQGVLRDICKPTGAELFEKRFGMKYQGKDKLFSSVDAKWKVFQYEQLAGLFKNYADMMKIENPDAVVTSLFRGGEDNRTTYGVAYDVMGSIGGVNEMSSNVYWSQDSYLGHYLFANETKKLIGASRERSAAVTLQTTPKFDRNGYAKPIMVYGPAFSSVMHGARGINYYKQDFLYANGKNDAGPWVEKVFRLLAYLEDRKLLEYEVPKTVALLYSRASEDWWRLAHQGNPVEAAEAILSQNAVMEVLFRYGIPFDLYYLDQPSSWGQLEKYSLTMLPYPFSVKPAAVSEIKRAISAGARVVTIRRRGEVNEFAEAYSTPVFDGLKGMAHLDIDLQGMNFSDLSNEIVGRLDSGMQESLPLVLDAQGKDVECSVLRRQGDRLVFCLNWEGEKADVDLGLHLSEGSYRLSIVDFEYDRPGMIDGRSTVAARQLRSFKWSLGPYEGKVLGVVAVN